MKVETRPRLKIGLRWILKTQTATHASWALCLCLIKYSGKEPSLKKVFKDAKSCPLFRVRAAMIGFCLNKRKASSKLDCHYFTLPKTGCRKSHFSVDSDFVCCLMFDSLEGLNYGTVLSN